MKKELAIILICFSLVFILSISLVSANKKTTYIYAGNLLASKTDGETQYYIQDHLGSNRKVIDGEIEKQVVDYSAFGETNEIINGENDYLYTGK
ncbi:MAG: hypothetical protein ABIH59_02235, partial [archaeon]